METVHIDFDTDKETIKKFVDDTIVKYPDLDTIVLSAGIQYETWFDKPQTIDLDKLLSELNVNYTSILTTITYFLPHLLKLGPRGITPAPWVANYSATKAALHSLSYSLHALLQGTGVHVMEIIPPLVESEIYDAEGMTERLSKIRMPLEEYIRVTMDALKKGEVRICTGASLSWLEQFETGKDEAVIKSLGFRKAWDA
ncbi:NAD(P)-binding protein [Pleurotus eryngii]|uniref:NAD(P)-binding protein n=1 Tax=Pleurotus eryngii TaxID=5323 RepID=A0A9P5ZJA7_PLEER|nr:NAD(P)-binding protein [Pleurotus eryngii]